MTVNDLVTVMMREMDEGSDNTEMVSTYIGWISDAIDEIASATDWTIFKTVFTTALTATNPILELAQNLKDIRSIRFTDTDETIEYGDEPLLFSLAVNIEEPGKPRSWFFVDADDDAVEQAQLVLRFHPIPDSDYPIMISARKHPLINSPMLGTDEIPFRQEFIPAIKDRVRAYVLANDKDYEGMQAYLSMFYDKVNKLVAQEESKPGARLLVMQQRDISAQMSPAHPRLDPAHFRN